MEGQYKHIGQKGGTISIREPLSFGGGGIRRGASRGSSKLYTCDVFTICTYACVTHTLSSFSGCLYFAVGVVVVYKCEVRDWEQYTIHMA